MRDSNKNDASVEASIERVLPRVRINAVVVDAMSEDVISVEQGVAYDDIRPVTAADVAAIVNRILASARVYVLESDITEAQNAIKDVIDETYF